jgi:membrane protein DedA with SNARE-associated domain
MLARGEQAYARWGRLAVFLAPAVIWGTAKMKHGQFISWNLLASLGFSISVGATVYGRGRVAGGHHSQRDILLLVVGLGVGSPIMVRTVRRRLPKPPTPASWRWERVAFDRD